MFNKHILRYLLIEVKYYSTKKKEIRIIDAAENHIRISPNKI